MHAKIKNTSFHSTHSTMGFTLIELMVVIAIIAGMVVLATPYIGNRNTQTKAFLREMTVISRDLHTRAKLNGVIYRLVIDLAPGSEDGERPVQRYWVERSNSRSVLPSSEGEEILTDQRDDEPKDPNGFEVDTQVIKKPKSPPVGMRFDRVELTRMKAPITDGKAYIHYLPQGLVDEAAIHIKGEKTQAWTIAIHPLTGKAELIARTLSLEEIKSQ